MHDASSFLTLLFFVVVIAGATTIAADGSSPPFTRQEVNVVRQVAIALAAGTKAMQDLRGPPIEHSNLDRLMLPTSGMDCGIARSLIYVACNSAALKKNEAEAMFARIMDDVQTALPLDSWSPVEVQPHDDLIRLRSYYHLKSGAQIDIDLVARPVLEAQPVYWVRVYGWKRI